MASKQGCAFPEPPSYIKHGLKADATVYALHNKNLKHRFRAVGGEEVENQFGMRMRIIGGRVARDEFLVRHRGGRK